MSNRVDFEALILSWRARAEECERKKIAAMNANYKPGEDINRADMLTLRRCADQLEAALHSEGAPAPPRNPDRVLKLARGFAQEWLRPDAPEHATEALVTTLTTAMAAFYAAARSADDRDATKMARYGCHHCHRDYSHEPFTVNIGGIPARTFFFCSPTCRERWNLGDAFAEPEVVASPASPAQTAQPGAPAPPQRDRVLEDLAVDYHKRTDGTGEGEYGCNGATCPGVQRLIAFARQCIDAVVPAPPQGWRDIASAPKDADVILLFAEGWGVQPGYWDRMDDDEAKHRWICVETQRLTGGGMGDGPTHWHPMPLPPAPPQTEG